MVTALRDRIAAKTYHLETREVESNSVTVSSEPIVTTSGSSNSFLLFLFPFLRVTANVDVDYELLYLGLCGTGEY
jgi:hypothetical protein